MRDLTWFCDYAPDGRYALEKPFVQGGYEYATNGRVAVRQPAPGQPDVNDDLKRPKHMDTDLFKKKAKCTETWPTPTGFKAVPVEESMDYAIIASDTEIAGRLIAGCYVLLISLLGNVQYDPAGKPDDPLRFAAAGIEGTVMPLARS